MNRASGDFQHDSIAAVLGDPTKRALAAQIIGQAYVQRVQPHRSRTRTPSSRSRTRWSSGSELYGDELVDLLNSAELKEPIVDLSKEEAWPTL